MKFITTSMLNKLANIDRKLDFLFKTFVIPIINIINTILFIISKNNGFKFVKI